MGDTQTNYLLQTNPTVVPVILVESARVLSLILTKTRSGSPNANHVQIQMQMMRVSIRGNTQHILRKLFRFAPILATKIPSKQNRQQKKKKKKKKQQQQQQQQQR